MSTDRFSQLLSRKLAGEASLHELQELEELLAANPSWQHLIHELSQPENDVDDTDAEAAWAAHSANLFLSGRLHPPPKKRSNYTAVAAVLLLVVAFGWWLFRQAPEKPIATNEISTKKGNLSYVKLPDGSQVWLNTNTKLIYSGSFDGPHREVTLSGEAYFDVAKDSSRPFVIHTGKLQVKVLGTAFNLKNYPSDETLEAALIHGRIEVTFRDRPQEKIILKPNEKLVVRKEQNQAIIKAGHPAPPKVTLNNISMAADSIVVETAWLHNKIAFTNESLLYISRMLERKFDVQFRFNDDDVKNRTYTGSYENESLARILGLLSTSQRFEYSIQNQLVIIGK